MTGQTVRLYGKHRSGWNYAIGQLSPLHNPRGVFLDAFADRTFCGGLAGFKGYREPWAGFLHVPPHVPDWLQYPFTNRALFSSEEWKVSAPFCKGLFTLSDHHKHEIDCLPGIPVERLLHPTEFPSVSWNPERFIRNPEKKIIQSGWWLRRATSIFRLEAPEYRKVILKKLDVDDRRHLEAEIKHLFGGTPLTARQTESVSLLGYLPNHGYDELLSENLVFLDLIDASANNAVVECIARCTPVLVNPLPAVVEYLGEGYPFFFNSLEEAAVKAADTDLVLKTHDYLAALPIRTKLTGEAFRNSFVQSEIYRSL